MFCVTYHHPNLVIDYSKCHHTICSQSADSFRVSKFDCSSFEFFHRYGICRRILEYSCDMLPLCTRLTFICSAQRCLLWCKILTIIFESELDWHWITVCWRCLQILLESRCSECASLLFNMSGGFWLSTAGSMWTQLL